MEFQGAKVNQELRKKRPRNFYQGVKNYYDQVGCLKEIIFYLNPNPKNQQD